jgi:hypothetical protein
VRHAPRATGAEADGTLMRGAYAIRRNG